MIRIVTTLVSIPVMFSCLTAENSVPLSYGKLLLSNNDTFQYVYRGDTVNLTDIEDSIYYVVEMTPIEVIQYCVYKNYVSEPVTGNDTSSVTEAKASTLKSYGVNSDHEIEEVVVKFELIITKPLYPRFTVQAGIEGSVCVKAIFTKSDGLSNIAIIKSSDNQLLDTSALSIVEQAEFSPETLDDFPQKVLLIIPITFRLM